ncbi:hypothetical protein [Phytohabitans kaempferiae]|uniref:4Fe-4S ferredoxin-type domain-containing protein n=1 Tax=Phytohabitans kaempferiae TaxID=1620943 RepID=A0ABV6MGI7_9ACTN
MLIDCDTCVVRGAACGGCLVSALLDTPPQQGDLTSDERRAIEAFARAGFEVEVISEPVRPRLRLMPGGRRRRHVA